VKEEWVLPIERQADSNDSAFFFKQWGHGGADRIKRNKYADGKLLKGKIRQAYLCLFVESRRNRGTGKNSLHGAAFLNMSVGTAGADFIFPPERKINRIVVVAYTV
jgi:hypothetical protein